MEKLKMETPDIVENNVEKIGALFPAAVTEMRGEDGKLRKGIDFEKLKQLLSRDVVDGGERYDFSWVGKKAAMAEAARPTTETLRPVKADSRSWDTTENLYIEGDNLAVLKILQESYLGKVKMIYIDPPYNTGNDFIYADDFMRTQSEENEQMGMFDEDENHLFKNTDTNGHFHSDWCSMICSRLLLARNLLSDDGVVFISIDDNEVDSLKKVCNEIFGESNFVAIINWKGRGGRQDSKYYAAVHEYILCYAKRKENFSAGEEIKSGDVYPKYDKQKGRYYKTQLLRKWGSNSRREDRPNLYYAITAPDGTEVFPIVTVRDPQRPSNCEKFDGCWRHGACTMAMNIKDGLVEFVKQDDGTWIPYEKIFAPLDGEEKTKKYTTWIDETNDGSKNVKELFGSTVFDYPKGVSLLMKFLKMGGVESDDIILDFFSGSATTAHAVMQLNAEDGGHRKFIMVQLAEACDEKSEAYKAGYKNICEIGKERIRRAGDKIKAEHPDADLDIGFRVFRVDSSNMQDVYYKPEDFTQTMLGETVSNIKPDRTDLDLLYACLLDCGVAINLPHTTQTVDGCTIHNVADGALMACFDEDISQGVIRAMAAETPLQAIFRDSAFAADADKINVTEIFKNLSPDTKVRVI